MGPEPGTGRCRNRMRSRQAWEQGGRAETRDAFQMHAMQRCTNLMPSAGQCQSDLSRCMSAQHRTAGSRNQSQAIGELQLLASASMRLCPHPAQVGSAFSYNCDRLSDAIIVQWKRVGTVKK